MLKNIAALVIIIAFVIELYLTAAGNQHKMKKPIKGWNVVKGRISSIEKTKDKTSGKTVYEVTIKTEDDRTIVQKEGIFCIYEEEEEVLLQEKNGYHKLLGNDRVGNKGKKELFWGLVPIIILLTISIIVSIIL